jgi:serine/threonine protein kinase
MEQLATILLGIHQKGFIHGKLRLKTIFWKKSSQKLLVARPRLRQVSKLLNSSIKRSIWTAPEITSGFTAGPAADVWQFGVVLLQLALCEDLEEKCTNEQEAVLEAISRVEKEREKDLLKRILVPCPVKRPVIAEVLFLISKYKSQTQISP